MIDRLIEFSARNRLLVVILVGAAVAAGVWSMRTVPLDAIPDLSDTQVIVYSRWDRSPDIVEDQVTYPIVTAMLGGPRVKDVRGFSDFGYSYVYVIFEEGTDIYWARSRTMEYLSGVSPRLPQGVRTELGPDASGVGWVFQYALVDTTGREASTSCGRIRTGICVTTSSRYRAWRRSRRSAASCGSTRYRSIPTACAHSTSRSARSWRPCGRATTTWVDAWSSCRAPNTWCAGAATRNPLTISATSCSRAPRPARRSGYATSARSRSDPTSDAASPISTALATRSPASSSCDRVRTRSGSSSASRRN